jgi:hypothetical protein
MHNRWGDISRARFEFSGVSPQQLLHGSIADGTLQVKDGA